MTKLVFFLCCCISFAGAQTREFEVNFESGSYQLKASQSAKLHAFIKSLSAKPENYTVAIAGHTDDVGEVAYNAVLSENRGATVAGIFKANGFSDAKILVSGRGEVHPIASNNDENGKAKNRRVKIKVFTETPKVDNIGGLKLKETKYEFDAQQRKTLTYGSGTTLDIPANAFVDKNGRTVKGKVGLKYIEYRDPIDFILGNIPMDHGGGTFNSGGMFKVLAYQDGQQVYLGKGKNIDINFSQANNVPGMNFYQFDSISNKWTERSKLPLAIKYTELPVETVADESTGDRYYGGCFGDPCYTRLKMLEMAEEYTARDYPVYEKYLAFKRQLDTAQVRRKNTQRQMFYVNLPNTDQYLEEDEAKDAYRKAIVSEKAKVAKNLAAIEKLTPRYKLLQMGNRKSRKFRIYMQAATLRNTAFQRTIWKSSDNKLPAEALNREWDSCHISGSGKNHTIVLTIGRTSVTLNNLSMNNALYNNKQDSLITVLNNLAVNQRRQINALEDSVAVSEERIVRYEKLNPAKMIGGEPTGQWQHPLVCFWDLNRPYMPAKELDMDIMQWYAHFDKNKPTMIERYSKITLSEECREKIELANKVTAAYQNAKRVTQSLQIDRLGIFNVDQVYRIEKPIYANASFQNSDGQQVEPIFIYVIDSKINGIFKYDAYGNINTIRFPYGTTSENKMVAFDLDGNSYIADAASFRKSIEEDANNPIFILKSIRNVASKEVLVAELNL